MGREETLSSLILAFDGYGITILGSCGVIMNISGLIMIFKEKNSHRMFNLLLSTLLIFDTLFLSFNVFYSLTYLIPIPEEYLYLYTLFVFPGLRFTFICSIMMTIALSHSRFNAVNNPIYYRNKLRSQHDRFKCLFKYVILTLLVSVVLTVPCFWEYEVKNFEKTLIIVPSSYRGHPYYVIFYVVVLSGGILGILPFGLLVYFTVKISKGITKNSIEIKNLNPSQQKDIRIFNQGHRRGMVVRLISVFFLAFHFVRIGLDFAELAIIVPQLNKNITIYEFHCDIMFWYNLLSSVSSLLLVLNSSINVIIYLGVNKMYPCRQSKPKCIVISCLRQGKRHSSNPPMHMVYFSPNCHLGESNIRNKSI